MLQPSHVLHRSRVRRFASSLVLLTTACAGLVLAPAPVSVAEPVAQHEARRAPATTSYDLGVRDFPQPLEGQFAEMPIRLWGALAAPQGDGPYPVVVIAHGAHGDGCPDTEDASTWPCWDREQRNDLGFAGLAERLAGRGMIVVSPDVNAAYSGGWGEFPTQERLRFRQVMDATLDAVRRAAGGEQVFDGVDLTGRVDLDRVGVIGHSRGGYNAVRWAKRRDDVTSLFLLAPYFAPRALPSIPVSVAIGTCDGDTGGDGLSYVRRALKRPERPSPLVAMTVSGANHNYYNTTLVTKKDDDATTSEPGCGRTQRATAGEQQAWLARVSTAHFRATLTQPRRTAGFLERSGPDRVRISGLPTTIQRYFSRR